MTARSSTADSRSPPSAGASSLIGVSWVVASSRASGAELGLLWATGVCAEILLMTSVGRGLAVRTEGWLVLAYAGGALRWSYRAYSDGVTTTAPARIAFVMSASASSGLMSPDAA